MNDMNRAQRRKLAHAVKSGQIRVPGEAVQFQPTEPQMPPHLARALAKAQAAERVFNHVTQMKTILEAADKSLTAYFAETESGKRDEDYDELRADLDESLPAALKAHAAAGLDLVAAISDFEEARLAPAPLIEVPTLA